MKNDHQLTAFMTRREMLAKTAAGAAVVAGSCLGGLRQLISQARTTGKAPLSANNLNELVPKAPGPAYRSALLEASQDPLAFLDNHFTMTQPQRTQLERMFGRRATLMRSVTPSPGSTQPTGKQAPNTPPTPQQQEAALQQKAEAEANMLKQMLKQAQDLNQRASFECAPCLVGGDCGSVSIPRFRYLVIGPSKPKSALISAPGLAPPKTSSPEEFSGTLKITISGFPQ